MIYIRRIKIFSPLFPVVLFFLTSVLSCERKKIDPEIVCVPEYELPDDVWIYPVRPGSSEWIELGSTEARWEACQIPESKVKALSTEALIHAWLTFPFVSDILLANSMPSVVDHAMIHFSGLQELAVRNDAFDALWDRYQSMTPACVLNLDITKITGYSFSFIFIEMLMANDVMLGGLTTKQKKDLVSEGIQKYNSKIQVPSGYFGGPTIVASLFLSMRAMYATGYSPFVSELEKGNPVLNYFFSTGILYTDKVTPDDPTIKTILDHAGIFLKNVK